MTNGARGIELWRMEIPKLFWAYTVWFLKSLVFVPIAYLEGLWFLIAHPLTFVKFVKVYKRYQKSIDEGDDIRASGIFEMTNRAERRALARRIK